MDSVFLLFNHNFYGKGEDDPLHQVSRLRRSIWFMTALDKAIKEDSGSALCELALAIRGRCLAYRKSRAAIRPQGIAENPEIRAAVRTILARAAVKGSDKAAGMLARIRAFELWHTGMFPISGILKASELACAALDMNAMAATALCLRRAGRATSHAKALYLVTQDVFEDPQLFGAAMPEQARRGFYGEGIEIAKPGNPASQREAAMRFFFPKSADPLHDGNVAAVAEALHNHAFLKKGRSRATGLSDLLSSSLMLTFREYQDDLLALEEALWIKAALALTEDPKNEHEAMEYASAALGLTPLDARFDAYGKGGNPSANLPDEFGRARYFCSCLNAFLNAKLPLKRADFGECVITPSATRFPRAPAREFDEHDGSGLSKAVNRLSRGLERELFFNWKEVRLQGSEGRLKAALSAWNDLDDALVKLREDVEKDGWTMEAEESAGQLFDAFMQTRPRWSDALSGPARDLAFALAWNGSKRSFELAGDKGRDGFYTASSHAVCQAAPSAKQAIPGDFNSVREARRADLRDALAHGDLGAIALSADAFSRTGADMGVELRMELIDAVCLAIAKDCWLGDNTMAGCTALLKAACHGMRIPSLAWARLLSFLLSSHEYLECLIQNVMRRNALSCSLMRETAFCKALKDAELCSYCMGEGMQGAVQMSEQLSKASSCSADEKPRLIRIASMLRLGCSAFGEDGALPDGGQPYPDPLACPGFGGLFALERAQSAICNRNFGALVEAFGELFLSSPDKSMFADIRRQADCAGGWDGLEGKVIVCPSSLGLWLSSEPDFDSCPHISIFRNWEWDETRGVFIRALCGCIPSRQGEGTERGCGMSEAGTGEGALAMDSSAEAAQGKRLEISGRHALSEELQSRFMPMCRKWLGGQISCRAPNVLLSGDSGSGKSWSLQAIARSLGIVDTFTLDSGDLGCHIHEAGKTMKELFGKASDKSAETGRPCAVIMEGIDSTYRNRQTLRAENDWTAEDVDALLAELDAVSKCKRSRVLVLATAQSEEGLDPAVLRRFPFAMRLGDCDERDTSEICQSLLGVKPDSRIASLLSGRSPFAVARFCEIVQEEQRDSADLSFDGCIGILNRLDGFTLKEGAAFSLPGQKAFSDYVNGSVARFLSDPASARRFGVQFPQSVMLYGKPGTGKSYAAQALARFLGWKMVRLDSSSFTPKGISKAFKNARACAPCVVVVDEIEAISSDRNSAFTDSLIVDEFLRVLDRARHDRLLVIGTTNFLRRIDPAVLRKGRFGTHIRIGALCREDCLSLAKAEFSQVPLEEGFDFEDLASRLEGMTAAEASSALEEAKAMAASRHAECVTMDMAFEALRKERLQKQDDDAELDSSREGKRIGFI
ncbi:MAG: ATP-binding protein [Aeromonadales bacterium]|nr:ATP-binding protein [Aeromonadales bacterium]